MLFLIAFIAAAAFSLLCHNVIKKYPVVFYIAGIVLTVVVSVLCDVRGFVKLPTFVNTYIVGLFSKAAFATALWCVVMIMGALPNGSAPIKILMPIRGELSILAALLTIGHNICYGRTYFVMMFTKAGSMPSYRFAAGIITIILLVIMVPLTVMSFKPVRKKMNGKTWKNIQRFAYLFYALLYLHVMVLFVPAVRTAVRPEMKSQYLINIIVYSIIFIGYAVMRIRKYLIVRKKMDNKKVLNTVSISVFAVLMAGVLCLSLVGCSSSDDNSSTADVAVSEELTDEETSEEESDDEETSEESSEESSGEESSEASSEESSEETTEVQTETNAEGEVVTVAFEEQNAAEEQENVEKQENVEEKTKTTTKSTTKATTKVTTKKAEAVKSTTKATTKKAEAVKKTTKATTKKAEAVKKTTKATTKKAEAVKATTKATTKAAVQETQKAEEVVQTEAPKTTVYKDGTYSGSGTGFQGIITVSVTISNDTITGISLVSSQDDPEYFDDAWSYVTSQIKSSGSASVDACSGATYSSNGIMSAVESALASARN